MKDGVYYSKIALNMVEIFVFRNVNLVQVRLPHNIYYLKKDEAKFFVSQLAYLGEV